MLYPMAFIDGWRACEEAHRPKERDDDG
jgi:hypothetical protein